MAFPKWFKRKAKNGKDHNESTVKDFEGIRRVSPEKAETKSLHRSRWNMEQGSLIV